MMSYKDFMNKVRHWDNFFAKWLMRHFYFLFFQIVLMFIFLFWFVNLFNIIDTSLSTEPASRVERILFSQSVNTAIIVLLLLLNSFWMLYVFNGIQRMVSLLKDVSFNIMRLRTKSHSDNSDQKYS